MSRLGRSFFGLPGPEDAGFLQGIQAYKLAQLSELRFVTQEVGSLSEAKSMPLEIRRWWIQQMQKKEGSSSNGDNAVEQNGKRFVTREVR